MAFGAPLNYETVKTAITELKIIHEDVRDGRDQDFTFAKGLLSEAGIIYFMGFGFNSTNVERLGLTLLAAGKSSATSVGLVSRERAAIETLCNKRVAMMEDRDCIGLCRHNIDWT